MSSSPDSPVVASQARVLVIDDNQDITDVIREHLDELGCAVEVAHDGPAALDLAATFSPTVCLLDLSLPSMDGCEVATRLREAHPGEALKLVAVTGSSGEADRVRAREAGFDEHLVKPFDLDDLTRIVST
ncbi:MAG TPA: response regulator [Polyangia bacterium]|nr:response regulator [Polyangia bacterium]